MADPPDAGDGEDDLFDGIDEVVPETVHASGPRKLIATFGLALAAFVFIGVAGGALLLVLVLRIRDHTDPNHTVRAKYSNRYTRCVQDGGSADSCSAQVLSACEKDPWWNQPPRTGQRETVCLATVPNK